MIYDKNGKLRVDRILKFETLNKDWKYIKDKYQFDDLKKFNTTKKINKKYTSYIELDVETKQMIYEILKTDFINFNYSSIGYNDI